MSASTTGALAEMDANTRSFHSAVATFNQNFPAVVAGAQEARAAMRDVTQVLGGWIKEASAGEDANKRLAAALQAQGTATPEVIAQYQKLAGSFQKNTVHSKDLTTEMIALLAQVGHVMPKDMASALKAAANLAAGLQTDLPQATKLMAKALGSGGESLGTLKGILGETKIEGAGVEGVIGAINKRFEGQAAAQVGTYSGQMAQVHNAYNDAKQSGGELLVNVLRPMVEAFNSLPAPVQGALAVIKLAGEVFAPIGLAIGGIGSAIGALTPILTGAWPAAWRVAVGAVNLLRPLFGPVGIIAAGVAGWIMVFQNLDLFLWGAQQAWIKLKEVVLDAWNWISSAAQSVANSISGLMSGAVGVASRIGAHLPGRADGGDVRGGQAYIVGELGPEVFIPQSSGYIAPNHALGSMVLQPQFHFHGTVLGGNKQAVGRELSEALMQYLRSGGMRLPSFA